MTSELKALDGCSTRHLQGAGAYCGGPTTGYTASLLCITILHVHSNSWYDNSSNWSGVKTSIVQD